MSRHRKGQDKLAPEITEWESPRLYSTSNENFLQKQDFFQMYVSNYFSAYPLCVQTRDLVSTERLQEVHFYGIHSFYEVIKGIQETNV